MYRALLWKERQRARWLRSAKPSELKPPQEEVGQRGETLVYWYLRQAGYTVVARNWQKRHGHAEVDIIGWDGPILAFVEVKTRTTLVAGPPETAVSRTKQRQIAKAARDYLRRKGSRPISYRFDIASVVWDADAGYQVRLIKDAFKG
jgi:putative endonuclease